MPRGRLKPKPSSVDWDRPLLKVLDDVEPRPELSSDRDVKKNYAERLSRRLAMLLADGLRESFPNITPSVTGAGQESPTGSDTGVKKLDVKVWDDMLGLILSVSIKTLSFQDWDTKRTEGRAVHEERQAQRHGTARRSRRDPHRRQPFAVLIGLMFMPTGSTQDARGETTWSSFAHAALTFRKRTGRTDPGFLGRTDQFERFYVGLYELDGAARGSVSFFERCVTPHLGPAVRR